MTTTDPHRLTGWRTLPDGRMERITLTLETAPIQDARSAVENAGEKLDREMRRLDALAMAAVADSIVIPRDSLPEVKKVDDLGTVEVDGRFMDTEIDTADGLRAHARRWIALAEYTDAQEPDPLAVGDRVRILSPVMSNGARTPCLTKGDIGAVMAEADKDGDIRFRPDGTDMRFFVAAANVERIEDQS